MIFVSKHKCLRSLIGVGFAYKTLTFSGWFIWLLLFINIEYDIAPFLQFQEESLFPIIVITS